MDDVDHRLLSLITENPRIHLRELARRLGVSRQAVHQRMKGLTEMGVIKGTIAGISIPYLDAVPVMVYGRSNTASVERTLSKLGDSELTRRVLVTGGNCFYVVGFLRRISELGGYSEFVKRAAEMPDPLVGVYNLDNGLMRGYSVDGGGRRRKQTYRELSPLDLKIIASLRDNARRPIGDIADIVGVTPKTVRRHLEDMITDGSLDMSTPQDLASGGDIFTLVHIHLKEGADKEKVGRKILSKYTFADQYVRTFSNIPGFLIWVLWSNAMPEIRRVLRDVDDDDDVTAVMANFAYLERLYSTWRDRLPERQEYISGVSKTGGLRPRPARR